MHYQALQRQPHSHQWNQHTHTHNTWQPHIPQTPQQHHHIPRRPAVHGNWVPVVGQCFKCLQLGHLARHCTNVPRCPFHPKSSSHVFTNCIRFKHLAQKAIFTLSQRTGRTGPATRRFLGQSGFPYEGTPEYGPTQSACATSSSSERTSSAAILSVWVSPFAFTAFTKAKPMYQKELGPPLLPSSLNSKEAFFFLDTGSAVCLISTCTLRDYNLFPPIQPLNLTLQGVTGNTMPILGKVTLNLPWGDEIISQDFVVVGGTHYIPGTALLGHNLIARLNLWLNPRSNSVVHKDITYKLLPHSSIWGPNVDNPSPPTSLTHAYIPRQLASLEASHSHEMTDIPSPKTSPWPQPQCAQVSVDKVEPQSVMHESTNPAPKSYCSVLKSGIPMPMPTKTHTRPQPSFPTMVSLETTPTWYASPSKCTRTANHLPREPQNIPGNETAPHARPTHVSRPQQTQSFGQGPHQAPIDNPPPPARFSHQPRPHEKRQTPPSGHGPHQALIDNAPPPARPSHKARPHEKELPDQVSHQAKLHRARPSDEVPRPSRHHTPQPPGHGPHHIRSKLDKTLQLPSQSPRSTESKAPSLQPTCSEQSETEGTEALPSQPPLAQPPPFNWPKYDEPHFVVTHGAIIPAYSALLINVKLNAHLDDEPTTAFIHPMYSTHSRLTFTPGLYTITQGKAQIHALNVSSKSVFLKPGHRISNADPITVPIDTLDLPAPAFCGHTATTVPQTESHIDSALHATTSAHPPTLPDSADILKSLFKEFPDVLPSKARPLGRTDLIQHTITLTEDARPVRIPAYRVPHSKRNHLDSEIKGMLELDIIEPSNSPWSFPLLLVPKSDGSFRPVVDYRPLNKVTVPEPFPMPNIRSLLLDIKRKTKIFTSLDLAKGFLQVPLEEKSRPLTAFSTPSGHYQFKVAPMGLRNSPLSFCRLMALVLQGLLDDETLVYLDDVLICSETIQDHYERLRRVFQRLQVAKLTINPVKCKFFQNSLTFLGHTISSQGIQPNLLKVKAVQQYPQPTNPKEIKQFLGLTGFYRGFVKDYGQIASPLTDLLKKDAKFKWGSIEERAFNTLKSALTEAPILAFPDYGLPFHLYTDASSTGLGAVLMQKIQGRQKPIAFASRVLSPTERRYHTTDREMLAAVWGLQHFREIIHGYKIVLWTDHAPITTTLDESYKDPHGRKARYLLTINDFDVKINYIKGVHNTPPDALSRVEIPDQDPSHDLSRTNPLDFPPPFATGQSNPTKACALVPQQGAPLPALKTDDISKALREDPAYGRIIEALSKDEDPPTFPGIPTKELEYDSNLLYRISKPKRIRGRTCVSTRTLVLPDTLVPNILQWAHEGMFHQGLYKTIQHVRSKYFFPRLVQRVSKHVRSCKTCPLYKGSTGKQAPYGCYDIPSRPWERVFSDILSLPPSAKGNRHLLVFIDQMSRFCELTVIQDKTAETIAKALHDIIICRHGCPSYFIHDNAKEFSAQVIDRLCKLTHIEQPNIMPYRPQANGFSERLNRSILNLLRTMTDDQKHTWCEFIPAIQGAINGSYHTALGDSPDFLLKGYDKRLPYDLLWGQTLPLYTNSFSDAIIRNTQVAWNRARKALTLTREKALALQEKKPYQEKIQKDSLVFHKMVDRGIIRPKLSEVFEGPFRVESIKDNKAKCRHLATSIIHKFHVDTLKLADKYYQDPIQGGTNTA